VNTAIEQSSTAIEQSSTEIKINQEMKIRKTFRMPIASLFFLLLISFQLKADDPGLPGGDPDLPETPVDGGVWLFILLLIIYGVKKLNSPLS
jgi:hypothetical protein